MEQKISTWLGFLVIGLTIFPATWVCHQKWLEIEQIYNNIAYKVEVRSDDRESESLKVSDSEKQRIDDWIKENNLNEFGDPKDTVYPGGTPLFNEITGEQIDRYEYIIKQHSDRPWNDS